MSKKAILVLSTLQNETQAKVLSEKILQKKLAACVSVLPGLSSRYFWKDKLEEESECLMLIKSTPERWQALEKLIKAEHPYECPEILAFDSEKVGKDYLKWLMDN